MNTFPRYTIISRVQAGKGYGNRLGARTANLDLKAAGNLPPGLYSCQVVLQEKVYKGLLYYGINSLTNHDCLEAHLFDFEGELYGHSLTVTTEQYLRPPKKFDSVDELAQQIKNDLDSAAGR